ncbi:hypothetical protein KDAU_42300 [Dictyobacter aurantiacus]|uniref:Uncharacterized protein n=1 Tax=Dictyobacter aurantiacus TaxID=1936993 RepID=A0A401ZJ65_9CHLR|nr:hypothetical protein KDAU_42300 [Dictyobacter aurantiacus]
MCYGGGVRERVHSRVRKRTREFYMLVYRARIRAPDTPTYKAGRGYSHQCQHIKRVGAARTNASM